jgi:hypothetical protein
MMFCIWFGQCQLWILSCSVSAIPENFQWHFILRPTNAYQSLLQLNSYNANHT